MLISFEGIDGCGKSTQIKLLQKKLEKIGKKVFVVREPGGTTISEKIRNILLDTSHIEMCEITELLLFSASRAQIVEEIIKPKLKKNEIVICDRFFDSTTAYQGFGRKIDLSIISPINLIATQNIFPNLTFFIDVPISLSIERMKLSNKNKDRMESVDIKFIERVKSGFVKICEKNETRFVKIDGTKSIKKIQTEIFEIVKSKLIS